MKKILYLLFALVLSIASFGVIGCNPPQKDAVNFKYYKDANNTIADLTAFKEKLTALSKMISTQWIDAVSNDKELYDYFNSYEISEYIYKNFK